MSVDRSKLDFYSGDPIDKVLNIASGSFSAPQVVGTTAIGATTDTGVDDLVFFDGVFTVGDSKPQDLGSVYDTGSGQAQVWATCTNGTLAIRYYNSGLDTVTVGYKACIIAKSSNTVYTVITPPSTLTYLNGAHNYQKIYLDDKRAVTAAAGTPSVPVDTLVTVKHGLGYRPALRAFLDNGVTLASALDTEGPFFVGDGLMVNTTLDNTNVYFRFTNISSAVSFTLNYRIYYDPNTP